MRPRPRRKITAQKIAVLRRAEPPRDKAQRDSLLTFVIVGGGPTGVEMAGALAELSALAANLNHAMPALVTNGSYSGNHLGKTWTDRGRRSAFVGSFAF